MLKPCSLILIRLEGGGGGGGGVAKRPSWYILSSELELVFAVSALFYDQVLFFVCLLLENDYIFDNISRIWVQKVYKKLLLTFHISNWDGCCYKLSSLSEISFIHKVPNFNARLKIWWRHQKSHMILINILVFFKGSFVGTYSCKVS